MARNGVRVTSKQSSQLAGQGSLKAIALLGATLVLLAFTWGALAKTAKVDSHSLGGLLGFCTLFALLALSLELSLSRWVAGRRWRYRLAFLCSACLPVFFAVVRQFQQLFTQPIDQTVALPLRTLGVEWAVAGIGAFIGSLFATWVSDGLWENNFPPSPQALAEVYQWHLEVIGYPEAGSLAKRGFDFSLALLGLLFTSPIWLASAVALWLEDPGPLLFIKNSVGRGGVNLRQLKFRTMVCGAEDETGPVLSRVGDERVLFFGRFLRKTTLDELPQLINILRGEMSFVGPRPQRTVLVHEYLQSMPEYAERHRVLPGLAGLAQVAGDYYLTPRQKLRFDRLYILHASLGFDLKLLFLAGLVTFWFRWQPAWNGRLPRRLLHGRNRGTNHAQVSRTQ
jgi:lipopolysaccharide/colanic/teichoic acid biosynthesis glycosyltransferase